MGKSKPPTVHVIAGPNGAGKTTFATLFLPRFAKCYQFLNADLIAAGLSPFAPETQNVRAGRLLLERIDELALQRVDFGFETTLSGRTYIKRLSDMRNYGYKVIMFFLWLPNVEMAVNRVVNRVEQGGHNVPVDDVRRRYAAGLRNLIQLYSPILDGLWIYEASYLPPKLIALKEGKKLSIKNKRLFGQFERQVEEFHEEEKS